MPLPPERAFAVVVALSLAVLAAALFTAAHREAGSIAALVAVVALAFGVRLEPILWFAHSDGITAALVVLGVALRRLPRVAALVGAGLLRPEAWVLSGIAGFTETGGHVRRRVVAALGAFLLPALLWALLDLVLAGDALATRDWREQREGEQAFGGIAWRLLPGRVWERLLEAGTVAVLVLGAAGLLVNAWRTRRGGKLDPLPLAVPIVWVGAVALGRRVGIELNARYFLPAFAVLALGCGLLAGALVPGWLRLRWLLPAAAAACAALVLAAVTMGFARDAEEAAARAEAAEESLPAVESALGCGRLATTGNRQARALIPVLAGASRRSIGDFGLAGDGGRYASVLRFDAFRFESGRKARGLRRQTEKAVLPPWPQHDTALGTLAVAPSCP